MPAFTTNLNLKKPTVGGDTNVWGGYLNDNSDTLDGIFNAAGNGTSIGLQVGSGKTLTVGGTLTASGTTNFNSSVKINSANDIRFYESAGSADHYTAIKASADLGGNNYTMILPAAIGAANKALGISSVSGTEATLGFIDVSAAADNYFATSGLSNKDLGVGLHLKLADSGADVNTDFDELIIEGTANNGLTLLSSNSSTSGIAFGDPDDNDVGQIKYSHTDNSMVFRTNGTDRVTIESGGITKVGELKIGNNPTGSTHSVAGIQLIENQPSFISAFNTHPLTVHNSTDTNSFLNIVVFQRKGVAVGTISGSNTSTSYNTSSDYRLKENVVSINDGIERVKLLKPCKFNFIVDEDLEVDGFLAHEVSDIVPEAITGEKDAVDENGDPIYQGIDQSKIVPLLTASIQELITKVELLENEIESLKGGN
tara:strand:+ start:103 stop:1380 length:1278 start_codon:yes stop_codon:yes gene_type:complete